MQFVRVIAALDRAHSERLAGTSTMPATALMPSTLVREALEAIERQREYEQRKLKRIANKTALPRKRMMRPSKAVTVNPQQVSA
jgi:hypothetical protein